MVDTRTLDELVQGKDIFLLKLDIEGAAQGVFVGVLVCFCVGL